jgi:hypothetical protein
MKLKKKLFVGLLAYFFLPLLLSSCIHRSTILIKKIAYPCYKKKIIPLPQNQERKSPPPITLWIHGTRFIPQTITSQLQPYHAMDQNHKSIFFAKNLDNAHPKLFPRNYFYSFVWSGGLSNHERTQAANTLYQELQKIISTYQDEWNAYPVIRIITHSHGGNVALNMVNTPKKSTDIPIVIDALIMLACPVQNNTMHLTQNSMFRSIYSLYSSLDMVQVIAPQKFHGILPFSYRKFPTNANIIQAKIRINGYAVFHTEFTHRKFFTILPTIFTTLERLNKERHIIAHKDILLRINTRAKNRRPYHRQKEEQESTD